MGGRKPGYTQTFLKVKKERTVKESGLLQQLVVGKEDAFYYVPIQKFEIKNDFYTGKIKGKNCIIFWHVV